MTTKPYYQRTLDDFPDEVIVRVRQGTGPHTSHLWYAVLNTPNNIFGRGMPDFAPDGCAKTKAEAIANCAKAIRNDARGIGKYAPHSCFAGYDFHWILCAHWARCIGETVDSLDTYGD